MGWLNVINLPQKLYPRLVSLFYVHLKTTDEEDGDFSIISNVKSKAIEFDIPTLARIIGVEQGDMHIYFHSESDLLDIVGNISEVYTTICERRFTGSNLQARHLKPHLRILHRFIVENATPKRGHFDIVPNFNAYLLYCFEVEHKLDLCYILMKEMLVANLGYITARSLVFGALLTKIFKAFKIQLVGEVETKLSLAISEYTLTRVGGIENLLQSMNANAPKNDDPEDPHDNTMPTGEQPQYWTDFLAMKQEQHNQRVQWEQ
ncbi:hypothetical protein ACSBR2_041825 [Camellia fascicularis]